MTTLLKGERYAHTISGAASSDTRITAFDLPADSVLKSVSSVIDLVSVIKAFERETAIMYAAAAYIIPIDDPDSVSSYDNLWDRFVPKYTDVDTIDLDTGSADATPFWEPGEADFTEIFDMGDKPLKLFSRRKMLTFANPGTAGLRFQPAETPFEAQWMPADSFRFNVNRSIRIRNPSVVMLALSNPALDDTTTTFAHLIEEEWGQIQFVESTLERALMDQLNLVEAGATIPWENASAVLRKHLAPDVFEGVGATFLTNTWNMFSMLNFSHTVPGKMSFRQVDLTP